MGVTYVSDQRDPEWRVAADVRHLVIEVHQRDYDGELVVGTACGLHIVPSVRDFRLNQEEAKGQRAIVPTCRPCEVVEGSTRADAKHAARLS